MKSLAIREKTLLIFIALALFSPIFLGFNGGAIRLTEQFSGELSGAIILPLSTWLFVFIALFGLLYRKFRLPRLDINLILPVLLLCLATLGILLGRATHIGEISFGRYIQTVVPILFLYLGAVVFSVFSDERYPAAVIYFLNIALGILLIWQFGYAYTTLVDGADSRFSMLASHFGPFYNLKIKRFYPVVLGYLAIFSLVSALHFRNSRTRYSICFFILAVSISLYWARTSVMILLLGLFFLIWIKTNVLQRALLLSLVTMTSVLFIAFMSLILSGLSSDVFENGSALQRTLATFEIFIGGGLSNDGDIVRVERVVKAFYGSMSTPFGDGFRTYYQDLVLNKDILVAENGYLDLGVRVGVLGILLPIYLFYVKYKQALAWSYLEGVYPQAISIFFRVFIIMSALGSTFWLHQFTEPFAGAVLFFLLGAIHRPNKP